MDSKKILEIFLVTIGVILCIIVMIAVGFIIVNIPIQLFYLIAGHTTPFLQFCQRFHVWQMLGYLLVGFIGWVS